MGVSQLRDAVQIDKTQFCRTQLKESCSNFWFSYFRFSVCPFVSNGQTQFVYTCSIIG